MWAKVGAVTGVGRGAAFREKALAVKPAADVGVAAWHLTPAE